MSRILTGQPLIEVMRAFKYLMGIWTAVAVYSLFSLLNGPVGLSAYKQLESEREKQWTNMRALGTINEELENTQNGLLYDQQAIVVYARRLGYAREQERFIRIVGLPGEQNPYASPGHIYFAGEPDFVADKTIKITALCAGMAAFALFFVLELLRNVK
jgi:cell division protein FtsB